MLYLVAMFPESMQGENFLLTVAVVSLGFAGFVGIIQAFGEENRKTRRDNAGVELILENTAAAFFLGLLPFPLFYGLSSERQSLAISSAVLALASFLIVVRHVHLILYLLGTGDEEDKPRMLSWFIPLLLITFALGTLEFYNVFHRQSLWVYTLGLLWFLVVAGGQFVSTFRFLLSTKRSSDE